jgi:anti-anti-sigma factor
MLIDIISEGDISISLVRIEGKFTSATINDFRDHIATMMAPGKNVRNYVVDLKHVDSIDSAVLGSLMSILMRVRALQGDIRLACLQSGPRRTLDIIDADEVFRTYETRGEAARSYQDDLDLSNGA